ncbi:hypothetical protein [Nocardia sp. NPDC050710]|uniref:hypothetical protein n=1 Tax=Nocardia sp. NPDC050710 TaxID=3157220 RepID=UPI0033F5930A
MRARFRAGGLGTPRQGGRVTLFGPDWTRAVTAPEIPGTLPPLAHSSATSSTNLSRDLSVQLSGWMLLEADYQLTAVGR